MSFVYYIYILARFCIFGGVSCRLLFFAALLDYYSHDKSIGNASVCI